MIFGYARVSTPDQVLHLQTDALKAAGCTKIVQEKISSAKERPVLTQLVAELREGDTLIVWKLDRLGRSLKDLVTLVGNFQAQGVHFISLQDHLDTTTAQGRLMFNLFASLAEFERDIIRERTNAGLTAARARGRQGGRPKGLSASALSVAQAAKTLYLGGGKTTAEIGQVLGVGRATIYRYLAALGVSTGEAPPTSVPTPTSPS
ncbi:recombinase family protein [Hymenobacter sp. UV11]|uniref:recombinase family protein n=1 Tax=Hymenobacter sp. UV11 TaxID=1849735 RepID=UPI00105E0C14|nr:recombinase family protein [Hymenobacter sp. UV11]TDN37230.1 resolvase [Hymenobacter sp. UV11]TFZ63268.1 recombinase family protein [Hymenobacter sp. UV11]